MSFSNPFLKKRPLPHNPQSIMDNEVKEQGFTDRLLCPTGLRWDAATSFHFLLILFFSRVVTAWLAAARALEGSCSGRRGRAAARGGGGGSGGLRLDVDGVAVVCSCAVVGEGGIGGGGCGLLSGLAFGRPRRRDGPHVVGVEGGRGGDGGVGGGSVCRLRDDFWWGEGEEARNG